MDIVDRDMVAAEREASRRYSDEWNRRDFGADGLPGDSDTTLRRAQTQDSISTASTDSTSDSNPDGHMERIATAAGVSVTKEKTNILRTRTSHPLDMSRSETHRLQHVGTVGASIRARKAKAKAMPNFGGGKPYPPDLPPHEDYVVEFDGPDDRIHPQNWTMRKRVLISAMLAYTALCSTFASSVFSASAKSVAAHYGVGLVVATLSTSLYVLGYAFGPLIWGPFSELQGRKLPLVVGMFGFTVFCFACAASKDLQTLLIGRFFAGLFGSAPLVIVAAIFGDIFDNTQRGTAIVIFSVMVFFGPMLGPFVGGYTEMNPHLNWRFNLYWSGIMGSVAVALNVFFLEESYPPIVLVAKAAELRRLTKNWGIHAKQEEVEVDFKELITKNFSRPIRLLITEPIILAMSIYMSFIYGLIYLFLTAYPLVFNGVHGFNEGESGLPFFGMVVGIAFVAAYIIWDSRNYNKKLEANDGVPVAEWRLPPVMVGGVFFTLGLFWFGWTGFTKDIPWIVPALSGLFTGFGLLAIFIQCLNYLVDSYLMFAASAIAANTFLRSITAAGFPLFARQMFLGMHIQWAATLLGCFSAVLIPIPILFHFYGKNLRQKSKFAPTMKSKDEDDDESTDGSSRDRDSFPALHASKSRRSAGSRPTSQVFEDSNKQDLEKGRKRKSR